MCKNLLKDKVCIVTGSTSGMGAGIARLFASEGAEVVVTGRDAERGESVVRAIRSEGGYAEFIPADVGKENAVKELIKKTVEVFSGIDILVPNAGILGIGSVTEISTEDWMKTIDTNLNGVFFICKYGIPELIKRGGGSVVINGSIAAFKGFPNHPAYCASKGALIPLTKVLAMDYAKHNIRVNCLCPGPVDTPLIWDSAKAFPNPKTAVQEVADKTLIGRLGTPEDIAKAALFLASDNSSWITGSAITIDGGIMTGN